MSDIQRIVGIVAGGNCRKIAETMAVQTRPGSPLDSFFAAKAPTPIIEDALPTPAPLKPVRDVVDHHVAAALAAGILAAYPTPASPREAVDTFVDVLHELERRGFSGVR